VLADAGSNPAASTNIKTPTVLVGKVPKSDVIATFWYFFSHKMAPFCMLPDLKKEKVKLNQ
jgi:hypothetical protein